MLAPNAGITLMAWAIPTATRIHKLCPMPGRVTEPQSYGTTEREGSELDASSANTLQIQPLGTVKSHRDGGGEHKSYACT